MLVYRVFPHLNSAKAGEPGHPSYLHRPQGTGRRDNPDHYSVQRGRWGSIRFPMTCQTIALKIFRETKGDGSRERAGIRWWSFHRPQWNNVALWDEDVTLDCQAVETLSLGHLAVRDAAGVLAKPLFR